MRSRLLPVLVIAAILLSVPQTVRALACYTGTGADGTLWVHYSDQYGSIEMFENQDGTWDANVYNSGGMTHSIEGMQTTDEGDVNQWSGRVVGTVFEEGDYGMSSSQASSSAMDATGVWIDKVEGASCEWMG